MRRLRLLVVIALPLFAMQMLTFANTPRAVADAKISKAVQRAPKDHVASVVDGIESLAHYATTANERCKELEARCQQLEESNKELQDDTDRLKESGRNLQKCCQKLEESNEQIKGMCQELEKQMKQLGRKCQEPEAERVLPRFDCTAEVKPDEPPVASFVWDLSYYNFRNFKEGEFQMSDLFHLPGVMDAYLSLVPKAGKIPGWAGLWLSILVDKPVVVKWTMQSGSSEAKTFEHGFSTTRVPFGDPEFMPTSETNGRITVHILSIRAASPEEHTG